MAHRPRLHKVSALMLAVALASCGGGGVQNGGAAPAPAPAPSPAPAPATSQLAGQVVQVATPVTVTVQITDAQNAGQSVVLSTTVDATGNYSISVPSSVIPTESQVAAVITADGYLPTTVIYSTSSSGALTPLSATSALGSQSASAPIVLAPIAAGVFAFPGLDILGRLGDGNFTGIVNSKFQLPTPPNDQPVTMLASQRVAYVDGSKAQLQVSLLTRGLQAQLCPGANIRLRSFNPPSVEFQVQEQPLADSPDNGDFSTQTFMFALSPALVGGEVQLELRNGLCEPNNYDDVEVVGATGTLN